MDEYKPLAAGVTVTAATTVTATATPTTVTPRAPAAGAYTRSHFRST